MPAAWSHSLFAVLLLAAPWAPLGAADADPSAPQLGTDLSGDWYVLIHYKDDDSKDKSITKFKDIVWSVQQTPNTMTWEEYPFVVFPANVELYRRNAMQKHLPWEPDDRGWERIRQAVEVSSSAMIRKRLTGNPEEGYRSLAPLEVGGFNQMTFTKNWRVRFEKARIRIEVVDSLGALGFEGMEGATVYEVTERVGADELRGRYDRETLHGTFRMVRAKERRVVR